MNYKIFWKNRNSNYLSIQLSVKDVNPEKQEIRLPAWRPGRYEIQNFAQFLRNEQAFSPSGEKLDMYKISKDAWSIATKGHTEIAVFYEFYASIENAGGSSIDSHFFYLNPINCCMYLENRENESCEMEIHFENNSDIACQLPFNKNQNITRFYANSFHDLVDSPIMISDKIQHRSYQIKEYTFHVWIKGKIEVDWKRLLRDFEKFTACQIEVFGEFPEPEYHFMLWMLPHAFYHGVEHRNSTMMTLGPDGQSFEEFYTDFLGLASHELFHSWNVKRIRPAELLPYRYDKENYFETCFVAEGLTTFYGDWMLYRSGVFNKAQFMKELESTLRRHFAVADQASKSLLESSYDLWLDGYKKTAPHRTVSVYHKGALAGLILHALIKKNTAGKKGLDDVMKSLWLNFGKPYIGYTLADYIAICQNTANSSLETYFQSVIAGNESIWEETKWAVNSLGFDLKMNNEGHVQLLEK